MRAYGSHHQPKGTWSDDTSLMLCTVESLLGGFDTSDMGRRFVSWLNENRWTPWGTVFDAGLTTTDAILRMASGTSAEQAGGTDQFTNGNGSLMRILPVALRYAFEPATCHIQRAHRVSSITHGHPRSQMACGFLCLLVHGLHKGWDARKAFDSAKNEFARLYQDAPFCQEAHYFQLLSTDRFDELPASEISSSGYVVHTLTASVWSLLTSRTFEETVLKAVNLGGDTDTTGCVAGGLAGVLYGLPAVRADWINTLARKGDLDCLFNEFADLCESEKKQEAVE
jgi:ADP-ribosylglycohydrolase